ncbi:sperm acrosome membrane-associated protein 4-like [Poecilia latipinna]|uniref:sperm acrosome membrane-associated protein 4-like n=1 Tax=Poecilia mexicana TaxID=48701 RepID=UPI00072ED198|nr:PREDICTED: sperm acrosome membrane-associated protein 4-like [Poecilia mexicana]XP_014905492.1 PREDICTED: sperm acrosome membrane-associated protein 4-like [Poecilia latipinna]
MKNFWTALIAFSVLIATAQCLTCQKCSVSVGGSCLVGKGEVTCADGESCTFSEASFTAKGSPTLHSRGCVAATSCGTTATGTIIGVEYTSKYACCTTNLCNGASAVQLSLTAGLCAAILSSLWGFI